MSYLINPFWESLSVVVFEPEYQAVLDYADTQVITTPPLAQNVINNQKLLNLKNEGKWSTLDLFYYGEYDYTADGLEEFSKLNWVSPGDYTLYQGTGGLVPTYDDNEGWSHNADGKFWKTGFIPSVNAVQAQDNDIAIFFKLYDFPTTWASNNFIGGGRAGNDTEQLYLVNHANGSALNRLNGNNGDVAFTQADINAHYLMTKDEETIGEKDKLIYINDVLDETETYQIGTLTEVEIYLLGFNSNGTPLADGIGGIGYFAYGSNMRFHTEAIADIMNGTYYENKVDADGVEVLDATDTSITTLMFMYPYKSSDFTSVTTTKDYFVIYGTDHDAGAGGIYWGECDDLLLTNFIERGKIIDGTQSETPHLTLDPDDADGDVLHLTYHPDAGHVDSGGYQQTRLLTASGGLLHTATWTDRGKVLGLISPPTTETHTGYLTTFIKPDTTLVGIHLAFGGTSRVPQEWARSTSVTGRATWTRVSSDIDLSSYMPYQRQIQPQSCIFFDRGGSQYFVGVGHPYSVVGADFVHYTSQRNISLCNADGSYVITSFIGSINSLNGGLGCNNLSFYIDGDTLHIYYTLVAGTKVYHTTWDLTNLD